MSTPSSPGGSSVTRKVKALYPFTATKNSGELGFNAGDYISVTSRADPNWWEGELGGKVGIFPSNYVEVSLANDAKGRVKEAGKAFLSLRKVEKKRKTSKTAFGPWANLMAIGTALFGFFMGLEGLWWDYAWKNMQQAARHGPWPGRCGLYCSALSVIVIPLEICFGRKRTAFPFPFRATFYTVASLFLFKSKPTVLVGIMYIFVAAANLVSAILREEYDAPPPAKKATRAKRPDEGCLDAVFKWMVMILEHNEVGKVVFLIAYFWANVFIFFYILHVWILKNNAYDPYTQRLSQWGPFAKAFGNLLDFNCSLLLLPVLRTVHRYMFNRATQDNSCFALFLRKVLYYIPLDHALQFHKLIAAIVMACSLAHVFGHFVNFAVAPFQTITLFGTWPWISGGAICVAMLFMYSSIWSEVKNTQFELFWYNHHWFLLFYGALLSHGLMGYQSNFWKWFIVPALMYMCERYMRSYRARQPIILLSCTAMDGVISIELAKVGPLADYKEGQYCFIMSPVVSRTQWHPFTISSAPEQKSVTFHMKCCGPGSWTQTLKEYCINLVPEAKGQAWISYTRQEPQPDGTLGPKRRGVVFGPEGRQIICIDGPHAAPTQHIGEYQTAVIVGAGIGVTPVAATLKAVLFHRWKYSLGRTYPQSAYFVWVCSHRDLFSFRWFVRAMKDAQDEIMHMRKVDPKNMVDKHFHVWAFITSVPKDVKPAKVPPADNISFWGQPRAESKMLKAHASFTEKELYEAMDNPQAQVVEFGDITVTEGRPKWSVPFTAIRNRHPGEVGVMFCGNPMIAEDLGNACYYASRGRPHGTFKFHKENF
eukprot:gb/GEZN01002094.1/.p1 GENE.gb/GEZN01002094.1/~~gb/GEZN01002094.1/.p1  ORF type:complete len:821 (+),score=43.14 gb/GEZN01002094.1/:95-2557(+)